MKTNKYFMNSIEYIDSELENIRTSETETKWVKDTVAQIKKKVKENLNKTRSRYV